MCDREPGGGVVLSWAVLRQSALQSRRQGRKGVIRWLRPPRSGFYLEKH